MRAAIVLLFLLATPEVAHADKWYGYQTWGVEAGGIAISTTIGLGADKAGVPHADDCGIGLGIGARVLGPPIVHVAHHEYVRAAVSIAARLAVPLHLLGGDKTDDCPDPSCATGAGSDMLGAMLAISLLDGLLAWAARTTTPPPGRACCRSAAASNVDESAMLPATSGSRSRPT
jgi:hypothetical protein